MKTCALRTMLYTAALLGASVSTVASDGTESGSTVVEEDVEPAGSGTLTTPEVVVPIPADPEWEPDIIDQAIAKYPDTVRAVLRYLGWPDLGSSKGGAK